jgi:anti-anti-sigma regulatory factor
MKLTLLPIEADGVLRVTCRGPVSLRHRQAGPDPLEELLGARCYGRTVLLNLERAPGIDTGGVCWVVKASARFERAGGKLVLVAVPPAVVRLLDVLRLTPVLALARDEAEARGAAPVRPAPAEGPAADPPVRPLDRDRPPRAG